MRVFLGLRLTTCGFRTEEYIIDISSKPPRQNRRSSIALAVIYPSPLISVLFALTGGNLFFAKKAYPNSIFPIKFFIFICSKRQSLENDY